MLEHNFKDEIFLMQQLQMGNPKAYDFLMGRYYQQLCAYAFSLVNERLQAEDIVQNVLVSIWENRKKIRTEGALKNYLYKSVYNEFVDQYRKERPLIYLEKAYFDTLATVVDQEEENSTELAKIVLEEIKQLPPKSREILLLSKKDGLTQQEIADYLQLSTKTIQGHITRAYKILEKKLAHKIRPLLFFVVLRKHLQHVTE